MLFTLTLLLIYQLIGEAIAIYFVLPIPGPVIGMALLFISLLVRGRVGDEVRRSTQQLLQHLSLLFVPAGAGVLLHIQRMADEWLPISLALMISTIVAVTVTAFLLQFLQSHTNTDEPTLATSHEGKSSQPT